MHVNTEVRASIAGLLVLQLVTSLTAIALLSRMGPVIEELLRDNADSLRAVNEMSLVLAARGTAPAEALRERFSEPLERARNNITESGEAVVIDEIARYYEAGLAGDPDALAATFERIAALREINHRSMERAEEREGRLAQAGSWSAVLLGLLGFGLSIFIVRRLTRRIVYPLNEIHDALNAFRQGDPYRRCGSHETAEEVSAVARTVNALLDERAEAAGEGPVASPRDAERAALLHLLDQRSEPVLIMDDAGAILAANQPALDRLAAPEADGLKQRLQLALKGGSGDGEVVSARDRIRDDLWIVAL